MSNPNISFRYHLHSGRYLISRISSFAEEWWAAYDEEGIRVFAHPTCKKVIEWCHNERELTRISRDPEIIGPVTYTAKPSRSSNQVIVSFHEGKYFCGEIELSTSAWTNIQKYLPHSSSQEPDFTAAEVDVMPLEKVKSTMISKVRYDKKKHILEIVFNTSPYKIYSYPNIPESLYKRFRRAKSLGKFFNSIIKGVKFPEIPS